MSWSKSGNGDKIGGLAGCNQKGQIFYSYALGSVTVDNSGGQTSPTPERVGGLAGCILIRGYVVNSYSAGLVSTSGTVNYVGGFVGNGGTGGSDGDTENCFWDTETSEQSTSSPTSGCTGETTENMKTQSTFTTAGWDFTNTWEIIGTNYPRLKDNPDPTLPVELSTFTGQYINNVPTLYWSTQTETDNLGWNVYRNDMSDFSSSVRVNNELIPGHGTSTQVQNYFYEDTEGMFQPGVDYWYWLESIDYSGTVNQYDRVAIIHIPEHQNPNPQSAIPRKYGLQPGTPNPFNTNLSFKYMLPQTDLVRIEIYNVMGQLIVQSNEGVRTADKVYTYEWDPKDLIGRSLSSGVILIKLMTSDKTYTQKAILLD